MTSGPGGTRAEASRAELGEVTESPFAEAWPEVERRLLRMLQRRHHVTRERGEDFVQEAALRVIRQRVQFDDADDLYRWTAVVVRRLAIDAWRRDRLLTTDSVLVDRSDGVDVEHLVERRLALEAVLRRWPNLSRRARVAIVMAVEERDVGAEEDEAFRSARYRGRQSLRRATKGLLAWIGITRLRRASPTALTAVPVLVAMALLLPVIAVIHDGGSPGATDSRGVTDAAGETSASSGTSSERSAPTQPVAITVNGRAAPDRRAPREVLAASAPAGVRVVVQEDRGATGPLFCAHPGAPIPGDVCTPRIGDLVELLPTPAPTAR